jgi:hypothetical protein
MKTDYPLPRKPNFSATGHIVLPDKKRSEYQPLQLILKNSENIRPSLGEGSACGYDFRQL